VGEIVPAHSPAVPSLAGAAAAAGVRTLAAPAVTAHADPTIVIPFSFNTRSRSPAV
jgi:hypothetical protein